ncbi:CSEP0405 putative effector protein [Blumeria hordei DH14]|uniref:CSEP0405 putative effector protein n=1 Tax=Blumeria graminis f. sp. hordei (strain DH14) TaxID=546991 RepID=N1JD46_BLUG1|nr:CSEP0405 putative effector protein [Blumeria hordei DH14]
MYCVLAITLLTAWGSNHRNRLVITSINSETPYYGTFLPDAREIFPVPKIHSDVYMTGNVMENKGTYLRAYCSHTRSEQEIIREITPGLIKVRIDKESMLPQVDDNLNYCHKAIEKLQQGSNGYEIYLSQIKGIRECPKGAIVSLAFWENWSFYGPYSNIFPKAQVEGKQINADVPLYINDEVNEGELYLGLDTPPGTQFLAWYQGSLHVFLRTGENAWYLLTDTDGRPENGVLISKLAWLTYGPFQHLHQFMATQTFETRNEPHRKKSLGIFPGKFESPKARLTQQMANIKLKKLDAINAQGYVGSSPRPEYIDSWMREIM